MNKHNVLELINSYAKAVRKTEQRFADQFCSDCQARIEFAETLELEKVALEKLLTELSLPGSVATDTCPYVGARHYLLADNIPDNISD